MEMTHYFGLTIELDEMLFVIGAACEPDKNGFEMKILVRSPMPRNQVPMGVLEEIEDWLDDVRRDYHQYHLMSLP